MALSRKVKLISIFILTLFSFGVYQWVGNYTTIRLIQLTATWLVIAPPAVIILTRKSKPKEELGQTPPPSPPRKEVSDGEVWLNNFLSRMVSGGGLDIEATAEGQHSMTVGGIKFILKGTGKPIVLKEMQNPNIETKDSTSALSTESIPTEVT